MEELYKTLCFMLLAFIGGRIYSDFLSGKTIAEIEARYSKSEAMWSNMFTTMSSKLDGLSETIKNILINNKDNITRAEFDDKLEKVYQVINELRGQ